MSAVRGTIAAAVTPLRDGGTAIDEEAIGPLHAFYSQSGLDGVLLLGTTGEGILFSVAERQRVAELALEAVGGLTCIVHAGAQTTVETVELAAHAAESGADAVAVIGPPYFAFDERELFAHFSAAAAACAPAPFFVYEFAARAGYALAPEFVLRLAEAAPNLAGLKVSDAPWERFEPYLLEGLDVLVGPESLIHRGLAGGAVGAVSGLAAGFPEVVVEAVSSRSAEATEAARRLRARVSTFPFQSALKTVLAWRGVPIRPDVRAPMRMLDRAELEALRTVSELDLIA